MPLYANYNQSLLIWLCIIHLYNTNETWSEPFASYLTETLNKSNDRILEKAQGKLLTVLTLFAGGHSVFASERRKERVLKPEIMKSIVRLDQTLYAGFTKFLTFSTKICVSELRGLLHCRSSSTSKSRRNCCPYIRHSNKITVDKNDTS